VQEIPARYGGVESGKLGYLLNFYTIPEARRKGICTILLSESIKEAIIRAQILAPSHV